MFIVWGWKRLYSFLAVVDYPCRRCGASPTGLHSVERKFTIYWIPIPVGSGFELYCGNCSKTFGISKETGQQLLADLQAEAVYQAAETGAGCAHCGAGLLSNAAFCGECGAPTAVERWAS